MTDESKVRTSPQIDEQVLEDLKTTIRIFNNGKLKGRLGPTFEDAAKAYMAVMYSSNPGKLTNPDLNVDEEDLPEDLGAYQERILEHADEFSSTAMEVAYMLNRDSPRSPTRLEERFDSTQDDAYGDSFEDIDYNSLF